MTYPKNLIKKLGVQIEIYEVQTPAVGNVLYNELDWETSTIAKTDGWMLQRPARKYRFGQAIDIFPEGWNADKDVIAYISTDYDLSFNKGEASEAPIIKVITEGRELSGLQFRLANYEELIHKGCYKAYLTSLRGEELE